MRTTDLTGGEGYNEGDFHSEMGGTSGACPVASGVAGLIISANPDLTARQVRLVLQASAERIRADQVDWRRRLGVDLESVFDYDERGHSLGFGYGRVDAANAVVMAQSFALLGPCSDDCTTCRNDQCATSCERDRDCPGLSVCLEDDSGVKACQWPEPQPLRIGAVCTEACDQCVRVVSQGQSFRNLCTSSCAASHPTAARRRSRRWSAKHEKTSAPTRRKKRRALKTRQGEGPFYHAQKRGDNARV